MFTCNQMSLMRPTATPPSASSKKVATFNSIRRLDMNSTLEILSFLDQADLLRVGAVSREFSALSRHPSLWRQITIGDANALDISGLVRLISYSTEKMPLNAISLSGPMTAGCYCRESTVCKSCSVGERCCSGCICSACNSLTPFKSKLNNLASFTVHNVKFLTSCPFKTILSYGRNLRKLDILNDLDVNLVVSALAASCPLLSDIKFKYSHGLDFDADFRQSHPLLRPQVAENFVSSCPNVRHISFCHYTVDEDCARCLLELSHVTEVNFSDNENLSGAFLVALPMKWTKLRNLIIRDCTELDNDYVQTFASMLLQHYGGELKYCPHLSMADFSCQWAFHGDSLVGVGTHTALHTVRSQFRWREDQCEVPGFGVDPDSGIDGIDEDEMYDFTMADIFSASDLSNTSAVLDEALSYSIHLTNNRASPQPSEQMV